MPLEIVYIDNPRPIRTITLKQDRSNKLRIYKDKKSSKVAIVGPQHSLYIDYESIEDLQKALGLIDNQGVET